MLYNFLFKFPVNYGLATSFCDDGCVSQRGTSTLYYFAGGLDPMFIVATVRRVLRLPLSPMCIFLVCNVPFLCKVDVLLLCRETPSSARGRATSEFRVSVRVVSTNVVRKFRALVGVYNCVVLFSVFYRVLRALPFPTR